MAAAAAAAAVAGRLRSPSVYSAVALLTRFPRSHPPPTPSAAAALLESPVFSVGADGGLRCFSTLRRHPVRNRAGQDIGSKARQLQNRRLWTYALTFGCVAGFVVIVLANFQDQLVFYVTPTDALEKYRANPAKSRFRLGGLVLEGSVAQPASSPEMEFVVSDLITDILVRYQGSLPDLFREGHSVVVEGFVKPFTDETRHAFGSAGKEVTAKARSGDCYFAATEVLAKHDEKYMPKEVAEALERNKAKIEAAATKESDSS